MADNKPTSSTCLELTISVPGFASSSPSLPYSFSGEGGGGMRNLDINKVPSGEGEEEEDHEWMMMMTTTTTGSMEEEVEEEEGEWPAAAAAAATNGGGPPRKKLRLTKEQSRLLEESFRQNHTLNPKQKEGLAMQLKLKPRQVEVWFQNRRARSKLKQTEMECEYLKRWFGSLTEQNIRLQKEVEELRSLKVGPPTVMTPHSCEPLPASTLTMCPRCERVTTTTTNATLVGGGGHDKGPTRITTTMKNNNNNNNATLSAKVPFLHSRHPSAAC
ncbi:hypothetical protein LguiB_025210 [Lonicera macranthoides]